MHPPKSIIILLAGMATIAIGANFWKGAGTAGATQITPNAVVSQGEQVSAATSSPATPTASAQEQAPSQIQTASPTPSTTVAQHSILLHEERESGEDD